MAVFILEDALSVWTNLGKHSLFVWLFVSGIKTGNLVPKVSLLPERRDPGDEVAKTGTRRIMRLDELSSFVRRSRRTKKIVRPDG